MERAELALATLSEEEKALILDLAASHTRIDDYKNFKGHDPEVWSSVKRILAMWAAER